MNYVKPMLSKSTAGVGSGDEVHKLRGLYHRSRRGLAAQGRLHFGSLDKPIQQPVVQGVLVSLGVVNSCRSWHKSLAYQITSALFYATQARLDRFRSTEATFAALESVIRPGDTVIDVGANVGRYTLRASKLVGPEGLVIALEPLSRVFWILKTLLLVIGIRNVVPLQCAASRQTKISRILEIPTPGKNYIFNTSTASRLDQENGEPCLSIALDDLLPLDLQINVMKIDVEGSELEVLLGSKRIIQRDKPKLIVEYIPEYSDPKILTFLRSQGYAYRRPSMQSKQRNIVASVKPNLL